MNRALIRPTAWALVAFLALGPLQPVLRAEGTNAQYAAEVRDRLANREGYEQMYQRQVQRQVQMQSELTSLQSTQMPSGADSTAWTTKMRQDQAQLTQQLQQNQTLMQRTQGKLTPIYQRLQEDAARIKASNDPELQTQLGVLVGAAGNYVVPIWGRPPPAGSPPGTPNGLGRITAAEYAGMVKYGAQQAHLRTVNWRIPVYENVAANASTRAGNASTALGNLPTIEWVPEPSPTTGNMRLVAKDAALGTAMEGVKPVETSVPARITNSQGQVIDNPNAVTAANDFAQLHNTRTAITNEISAVKLKASRAVNSAQQEFFERRAAGLEAKKTALEADIAKYQAENPSVGSRMSALGKDAGKWALMSVGVAATTNVVNQLAHNGWDPSKVNYGQAVAFLGDKHFWGGTAGSFVGSMAASALASAIPGGVFAKTALSIGGAALGWQVGSGNLANTDFIGLGVTTLGSAAGYMLGMAIGGPIGAFLGGIAGQFVSQFIYDKIKEMVIREEGATSGGASGIPVSQVPPGGGLDPGQQPGGGYQPPIPVFQGQPGYAGTNPAQTGYGGSGPGGGIPNPGPPAAGSTAAIGDGSVPGSAGSIEDADRRMRDAYQAAQAALAAGNRELHMLKMQEYSELRSWIQMKRQANGDGPADERSNSR